jgi:hypothetical protein
VSDTDTSSFLYGTKVYLFSFWSLKIQRKMLESFSYPVRKSSELYQSHFSRVGIIPTLLKSDVGLLLIITASLLMASLA